MWAKLGWSAAFRRVMAGGLLDAGCASATTLAVGIFAARFLAPQALGSYAVFFSAFVMACVIPKQLLFVPLEVLRLAEPLAGRLNGLRQSLRYGIAISLGAAILGMIAGWSIIASAGFGAHFPLAVTLVAAATLSPLQDHARRMMHLADAPFRATCLSAVQLLTAVGSLMALRMAGLPTEWIPFSALALANLVSLCVAWQIGSTGVGRTVERTGVADWLVSGRWLLFAGMLPAVGAFAVNAIVHRAVGPEILGHAEAARVVARPVIVLTLGLGTALRMRSMAAARAVDRNAAREVSRTFVQATLIIGLVYMAIVGVRWPLNPAALILPNAYVVRGLVMALVCANLIEGLGLPFRFELLGAGRAINLARVELGGNLLRAGVACAALILGAFAIPLGLALLGVVRLYGFRRDLKRHYAAVFDRGATTRMLEQDGATYSV